MKALSLILILMVFVSCAHEPTRGPASIDTDFFYADLSLHKSIVKIFPPTIDAGGFHYYFYLQIKNEAGKYVDIDEREVEIRESKRKVNFKLERQLRGRYYVKIDTSKAIKDAHVFIAGKQLPDQFKLSLARADKKMSKLKLLYKKRHRARFQLLIADSKGKGIEIPTLPEIIVEPGGSGEIEDLVHIKEGVWEFTMSYPEHNIVMYINVRAHGVYLDHLYRFQHVEN
jgi:hypothetical protein